MTILFKQDPAAYAVGRRANMEEWNALTRTAQGVIKFGVPVSAGSTPHTCKASAAAGENVLGISESNQVLPHPGDNYEAMDNVTVCEYGVIGVALGAAVNEGGQAFFNTTTGKWVAATGAGVLSIPGAQYDEAGAADAVGIVRYRRPVPSVSA